MLLLYFYLSYSFYVAFIFLSGKSIVVIYFIINILFRLINIMGDIEDLEVVLKKNVKKRVFGSGSCSALVKVLPNMKDLYFAQDTWSSYNTMLRILKKYSLKFHTSMGKGRYFSLILKFYIFLSFNLSSSKKYNFNL